MNKKQLDKVFIEMENYHKDKYKVHEYAHEIYATLTRIDKLRLIIIIAAKNDNYPPQEYRELFDLYEAVFMDEIMNLYREHKEMELH